MESVDPGIVPTPIYNPSIRWCAPERLDLGWSTTSAKSFWRLIGYRRVPSGTVAYQLETADTAVRFLPFDRTTVLVIAMRCGVTVTVVT